MAAMPLSATPAPFANRILVAVAAESPRDAKNVSVGFRCLFKEQIFEACA